LLPLLARELPVLQPDAAKMTAEFHLLFNVALAVIFIGPLDAVACSGAHPTGTQTAGRIHRCRAT
jgi:Na+/phosphate symporter